jgi:hypothetical protein
MGEVKTKHILVGQPEGKRPLGIPRSRWQNNIKMDLKINSECVDRIHLVQGRD